MTFNKLALGSKIKIVRERKGLTQQTLAELVDCTPTYISYCESGSRNMSLDTLIRVANALNVTTDELLVDSLKNTEKVSNHEFSVLLNDCNEYEKHILLDVLLATKQSLRARAVYFLRRQR